MEFITEFPLENIDDPVQLSQDYWSARGFSLSDTSSTHIAGKRGSLLGNIFSFNMSKLKTKLTVDVQNNTIKCTLLVNTNFQVISDWNKKFWELEQREYKHFLMNGAYLKNEWGSYQGNARKDIIKWLSSLILIPLFLTVAKYFSDIVEILSR